MIYQLVKLNLKKKKHKKITDPDFVVARSVNMLNNDFQKGRRSLINMVTNNGGKLVNSDVTQNNTHDFSLAILDSFQSQDLIDKLVIEKTKQSSKITFFYGETHKVERVWTTSKGKDFYPSHKINGKWIKGLGEASNWLPYHSQDFSLAKGKYILFHEGEKVTEYARSKYFVSTCIVGSGANNPIVIKQAIDTAKKHGIKGFLYFYDNDGTGLAKAKKVLEIAIENNFQCLCYPTTILISNAKENDDLADYLIANPDLTTIQIESIFKQVVKDNNPLILEIKQSEIINQEINLIPKKKGITAYDKYIGAFTLPIDAMIPLECCISPSTRDLLKGVSQGERGTKALIIIPDLLGTENYLMRNNQSYNGSAIQLFKEYCDNCKPSLPTKDFNKYVKWGQAQNRNPSLDEDKIINCIAAWYWKNSNIKDNYYSKKIVKSAVISEIVHPDEQRTVDKDSIDKVRNILVNEYAKRLKYNELKRIVELDNEEAYLDDFYLTIHKDYGIKISKQIAYDLTVMVARENSYHPVKDYLANLRQDSQEIDIKNLSSFLFGTTNKIYDEMVYRHLIGSVARVFKAGCKLDTALIFQGKQGIGKSTFFSILYGNDFFTDSVCGTDRDNLLILHQHWCAELAEFESITGKKASGELKAFLSKSVDTFREPYGRSSRTVKRQCVIVGSVNECEFLVDNTGNRRFWIIPIDQPIDLKVVKKYRDVIWYQAKRAFLDGENWYLTKEFQEQSELLNKQYLHTDSWDSDELQNYLANYEEIGITIRDILINHLGFEENQINRSDEQRIGKILTLKGYVKKQQKIKGRNVKRWFAQSLGKS